MSSPWTKNDDLEQYTRWQNLRYSGIVEKEEENTDELALYLAENMMNIDLDIQDIDSSHRVGRPNSAKRNCDIIVRFTSWRSQQKFMKSKKAVFEHN